MLILKNMVSKDFMESYIPSCMYSKAIQLTADERVKRMDNYIIENYHTTIKDVINQVYKTFEKNYSGDNTVLTINNSILEEKSQLKLSSLVRLINDGNTEVRGTKLLDKVKEFIHNNIQLIYLTYMNRKDS